MFKIYDRVFILLENKVEEVVIITKITTESECNTRVDYDVSCPKVLFSELRVSEKELFKSKNKLLGSL